MFAIPNPFIRTLTRSLCLRSTSACVLCCPCLCVLSCQRVHCSDPKYILTAWLDWLLMWTLETMQYLIIHVFCEWSRSMSVTASTINWSLYESKRRRRHEQFDILRPSLHCRSRAVQTFNVAGQSRNTQRLKGPETGAWLEECVAQHEHTQSSTTTQNTNLL